METFKASRWTEGNRLFPTVIEVGDTFVVKRTRTLFHKDEISMHLARVASVRISTGPVWSNILIESSGGTDPIASHGHYKQDALRIKQLIEEAQHRLEGGTAEDGATRRCPFCAETIRAAATVCRFCQRELGAK